MTVQGLIGKLLSALALVLFVGACAATFAYLYLRASVQPLDGTVRVSGLRDPVTVVVDSFQIPHVYAKAETDLFFTQGFLHASERLWQMEMFRRVAQGRLSELFGEAALPADRLLRTLDLWRAAKKSLGALDAESRAFLAAYAAGVNARIATWKGPLPPEFVLLGIEPEPWEPLATVAIGKVMALDLSAWRTELARFRAHAILPPEKAAYLPPAYPEWAPTIIGQPVPVPRRGVESVPAVVGRWRRPGDLPAGPGLPVPAPADDDGTGSSWSNAFALLNRIGFRASNAWAVGRGRTAHGGSLLASDMHLGLDAPSKWYVMALHAEETAYHVAGVSLPGAPGIVVGYNRNVAWGFTNGMTDDMDFVIEDTDPEGRVYRDGDGWREFEVVLDTIRVRGRDDPFVLAVRRTVRGPVVSDALPPLGATLSALWVADRPTHEIEGLLRMNRADGPEAFDAAVQRFDSPQQNVVFAASDGSIGYRLSGTVPLHRSGEGSLPIDVDQIGDGERSYWPAEQLPSIREPAEGFLVTANNLQAPNLFGAIGWDYAPPFRAARIRERLEASQRWSWQDMAILQLDTQSGLAERVGRRAVAAARRAGEDSAAALLEAWDRRASADSRAAGLFYAWFYRLRELVAGDEYAEEEWSEFPAMALVRTLEEDGGPWVDDVRTDTTETLPGLEERAMRDALAVTGLREWGELHFERSVHMLGRSAWLERLFGFNIGPYPAAGGPHTVRPDDYARWSPLDSTSWTPPYVGDYGPSERFVAVLGDGVAMAYVLLPTGQSGNPFSVHYRDMAARWGEPRLVPLPLDRATVEASAMGRLQLRAAAR